MTWLAEWASYTRRNRHAQVEYQLDPFAGSRDSAIGAAHLEHRRGRMRQPELQATLAEIRRWSAPLTAGEVELLRRWSHAA